MKDGMAVPLCQLVMQFIMVATITIDAIGPITSLSWHH